jgi:hypothetical protein
MVGLCCAGLVRVGEERCAAFICRLRLPLYPRTDHFGRNDTRTSISHSPSRVAFCLVRQENPLSRAKNPASGTAHCRLAPPKSSSRRRDLLGNSNVSHACAFLAVSLERYVIVSAVAMYLLICDVQAPTSSRESIDEALDAQLRNPQATHHSSQVRPEGTSDQDSSTLRNYPPKLCWPEVSDTQWQILLRHHHNRRHGWTQAGRICTVRGCLSYARTLLKSPRATGRWTRTDCGYRTRKQFTYKQTKNK